VHLNKTALSNAKTTSCKGKVMKVKTWGTRGSCPVSGPGSVRYGGNTTCVSIESSCLPPNFYLNCDAGTGFVPYGAHLMGRLSKHRGANEPMAVYTLFTHHHHDHTQGLLIAAPIHTKQGVVLNLFGPIDREVGPREMLERMMDPPFFPVSHEQVESRINFYGFKCPGTEVIVFHPKGGMAKLRASVFETKERENRPISFGRRGNYLVKECLVVKMHRSNHPEQTISYRFEEWPTGKVFVFLTDHEVTAAISADLRAHLFNADLLIADGQDTRETYERFTCGYGHGTGPYCYYLAENCRVKKLGITHHNMTATDAEIDAVLEEAIASRDSKFPSGSESEDVGVVLPIFACSDYQETEV
jgi:phosphoribosyl 1,2-cyclic phosphodiesterase